MNHYRFLPAHCPRSPHFHPDRRAQLDHPPRLRRFHRVPGTPGRHRLCARTDPDPRRPVPAARDHRGRPAPGLSPAPALRAREPGGAHPRLVRHHGQAQDPGLHPARYRHLAEPVRPLLRTGRPDHRRPGPDRRGLRPVDGRGRVPARLRAVRGHGRARGAGQHGNPPPVAGGPAAHLSGRHRFHGPAHGRGSAKARHDQAHWPEKKSSSGPRPTRPRCAAASKSGSASSTASTSPA